MSDLSRRAQRILHAVVSEYLQGGEAVGSRTVTRRHDLGLSPATVRNVMADLEDLGLLEQRHSSAGRVPTASGLRFFINELLKVRGLSAREKDEIRERVTAPTADEVVLRASRMLSDLTQHAAVILAPDPDQQRLDRIEFIPLRDGKLIAVLVTTDGSIENRLVVDEVSANSLERIHNYLNALLAGMTLDEVRERVLRELADDKNRYDDAVAAALRLGHAVFVEAPERAGAGARVGPVEPARRASSRRIACEISCARSKTRRRSCGSSIARAAPRACRCSSAPRPRSTRSPAARSSRCRTGPTSSRSARSR